MGLGTCELGTRAQANCKHPGKLQALVNWGQEPRQTPITCELRTGAIPGKVQALVNWGKEPRQTTSTCELGTRAVPGKLQAPVNWGQEPRQTASTSELGTRAQANSKHWFTTSFLQTFWLVLTASVYMQLRGDEERRYSDKTSSGRV